MAKTDIILTKKVDGLGGESDQLTVAAGYARNYLIPHGLAICATRANKRQLEALKSRRESREVEELTHANDLSKALSKFVVTIKVKTGEAGKLFGSVTAADIVAEVTNHIGEGMDKKRIHLSEPIKTLGEHMVDVRLHADVHVNLKVRVESLNPVDLPAAEVEAK
jgi:large subunit ribosomal protein L9